jgi:hypothetical protein
VPDAVMDRMAAVESREGQLAMGIEIARESVARIRDRVAGIQVSAPIRPDRNLAGGDRRQRVMRYLAPREYTGGNCVVDKASDGAQRTASTIIFPHTRPRCIHRGLNDFGSFIVVLFLFA